MKIAVLKERRFNETRTAATPESVKKLIGLNHVIAIEAGAGMTAGIRDEDYVAAGATVGSAADVLNGADIVFKVRAPDAAELATYPKGAALLGLLDPYVARKRPPLMPPPASLPWRWSSCRGSRGRSRWTCCRARPTSPVIAP